MTPTARAEERPIERLRLEWEAPDGADERAVAAEAIAALFSVAGAWLDPLAIELRVGCYDREIFTEGKLRPDQPFQLLVHEPRPAEVRIKPIYDSVESRVPALSSHEVASWIERALSQSCGDDERYQMSLRELDVLASRVRLPGNEASDRLVLDCYAGTVAIPMERRDGVAWVTAPPAGYGVQQPVELSLENRDGYLRFAIDIYWSPWVGEIDRPGSALAEAVARLTKRGWQPVSE